MTQDYEPDLQHQDRRPTAGSKSNKTRQEII